MGAPRPLVKSIQTVSVIAANALALTPVAAVAFSSRAPSMWTARPSSRADSDTARSSSTVHTAPPPKLWVCSTHTRRTGGPYGMGSV